MASKSTHPEGCMTTEELREKVAKEVATYAFPRSPWPQAWSPDGREMVYQTAERILSLFFEWVSGSHPADRKS